MKTTANFKGLSIDYMVDCRYNQGMKKQTDWRSLPRKPAEAKRTEQMVFKFTPAEAAAIRKNARLAGLTLVEFVARQCGPATIQEGATSCHHG